MLEIRALAPSPRAITLAARSRIANTSLVSSSVSCIEDIVMFSDTSPSEKKSSPENCFKSYFDGVSNISRISLKRYFF